MNAKTTGRKNRTTRPASSGDRSTARIYESLRGLIIDKKLPPGSKLNQVELARRFHVSRTPVVMALHKRETQGLVDNQPQRGFTVHQPSILELLDLFALREALDTIIISELTETITEDQICQLEEVFSQVGDVEGVDQSRYGEQDRVFHGLLLHFSSNKLARKVDEHFPIFNRAFIGGLLRKPAVTLPEHRRIIRALKDRNRDEAVEAVVTHITLTRSHLQEIVRKLQRLGVDPAGIPFTELDRGSAVPQSEGERRV